MGERGESGGEGEVEAGESVAKQGCAGTAKAGAKITKGNSHLKNELFRAKKRLRSGFQVTMLFTYKQRSHLIIHTSNRLKRFNSIDYLPLTSQSEIHSWLRSSHRHLSDHLLLLIITALPRRIHDYFTASYLLCSSLPGDASL
jgi:hypothetical protein